MIQQNQGQINTDALAQEQDLMHSSKRHYLTLIAPV